MSDLEVKLNINNQNKIPSAGQLYSFGNDSTFAKIFDIANKSFEFSKKLFNNQQSSKKSYQTNKFNISFDNKSIADNNIFSQKYFTNQRYEALPENENSASKTKDANYKTDEYDNSKADKKATDENDKSGNNSVIVIQDGIISVTVSNENIEDAPKEEKSCILTKDMNVANKSNLKVFEQLKNTNDNLGNEQTIEDNVSDKQLPNTSKITNINDNKANSVIVKIENFANIQTSQPQNQQASATEKLSDVLEKFDVDMEVTSVSTDNSKFSDNNQNNTFDFNTSSFNDLNGHIMKLSLNKTSDFSKIINSKLSNEQQIVNQIKEGTTVSSLKGTTGVSIILKPENLGQVNVKLITNSGNLSAQFTVQNQQTADALNKNIETLKQNLIEQGIKVNEISVKVQEVSQSDNYSGNSDFFDDKNTNLKEKSSEQSNNFLRKRNSNNENANNNENDVLEDNERALTYTIKRNNNDLGIYNNMGRKV